MKKFGLFFVVLLGIPLNAMASTTLMEVYRQAMVSDQIYQQAVSQRLSTKEGVPISLSQLLPAASILGTPILTHITSSGPGAAFIGQTTQRGYNVNLSVSQTIFNFSQFANLNSARALSKQADAILNAATQDLMLRVAKAYFAVLNDIENLRYIIATKQAYAEQLDQVNQQYKVGLKTITDVYTAQASYDGSVANFIAAQTTLANDKENLRVITGIYYPHLSKLSEEFPLTTPQPASIDIWVTTAQRQNWNIKAAQYAATSACQNVKQQFGGNLPSLQFQGSYDVDYTRTVSSSLGIAAPIPPTPPEPTPIPPPSPATDTFVTKGGAKTKTLSGNLSLNIPLVQGGFVVASTHKAQYDYQVAWSKLDQTVRNTINNTRQSYLGVISGIRKIQADRLTIKSGKSSLEGLRAAYQVGTETLVDVLNQQRLLVQSQQTYANDRFAYVNNLLALKAAAGTLSYQDLEAINSWLIESDEDFTETSDLYNGNAAPPPQVISNAAPIKHKHYAHAKKKVARVALAHKHKHKKVLASR
ncbi:MAG: TolC family outer membrane protein [Gammaproteobacteria bacterium]